MTGTDELVRQMADSLRAVSELNLSDDGACIRVLMQAGFENGDIVALVDLAMIEATRRGPKLPAAIRDGAAVVAAVAVWLAWYCVLCPAGGA